MNETKDSKLVTLSAMVVSFLIYFDSCTKLVEEKMKIKDEEKRAHYDSLYMKSYERMTFYRKQIEEFISVNI